MNNLMKILLVCLSLTYPLVAQQEAEYRDAKYPFAFTYNSEEWQIEATSLPDSRIALERTQDGDRLATFSIRARPFPASSRESNVGLYKNNESAYLKGVRSSALPGAVIKASGITYIAGREAVFVKLDSVFRILDDSVELTDYIVSLQYEDNLYILTCSGLRDSFDLAFRECKKLYGSFAPFPRKIRIKKN